MSYAAVLQFKKSSKLPIILQDEVAECGHACVAMISNFWGHELDLPALRRISQSSQRGVTLLTVKEMFESLGFTTRALRVSLEELQQVKTPAVIHWNMNHFVVLKKVNRNSVIIHDPAIGLKQCRMEEVSKAFTGIVLEIEKSDNFQKIRDYTKLSLYDLVKSAHGINQSIVLLVFAFLCH
ncbi:ABC transporter [Legionella hackeliae]|uniref:cysteine peptidase family C39 domain-containing protein n=1 Tax=Legionella hackeliae TaxID=449 RepID=UPI000E166AE2|nr:cysteine peptidase family C39 domain-containing protein [Legionella hackeliae]STX48999.1 ABC transporter [Legionella hackeliae]